MSHISCRQCGQPIAVSEPPGRDPLICPSCGFGHDRSQQMTGTSALSPSDGVQPPPVTVAGVQDDDPFMRPPWADEPNEAQPTINPYAPPADPSGGVIVQAEQLLLASRWQRLGGKLVDQILLPLAWMICCLIVAALLVPLGIEQIQWLQAVLGVFYFMGFLIVPFINWYLIVRDGQTIGKKLVGTKIVIELTGQIPNFFQGVVIRNWVPNLLTAVPLLGAIFAVVNVLCIFGDKRQCLHDLFAGTRVIQADDS